MGVKQILEHQNLLLPRSFNISIRVCFADVILVSVLLRSKESLQLINQLISRGAEVFLWNPSFAVTFSSKLLEVVCFSFNRCDLLISILSCPLSFKLPVPLLN